MFALLSNAGSSDLRKCEDSSEPLLFAYTRMDVDEDSEQYLELKIRLVGQHERLKEDFEHIMR